MKKRAVSLLLATLAVVSFILPALAAPLPELEPEEVVEESVETEEQSSIMLDGEPVQSVEYEFRDGVCYVTVNSFVSLLDPEAMVEEEYGMVTVNASHVIEVVDMTQDGEFSAELDAEAEPTANVVEETLNLTAFIGASCIVANGRYLYVPDQVQAGYTPEGDLASALVPVRTLAKALGASVSWEDGAVQISSNGEPLIPGDQFYDQDALFLLSHIIYNESGNQPMTGKIAVGNVLLNRVKHPSFPNTLYEVIYQPGQFYPESTGAMEKTPNSGSIIAAKLCLEGAMVLPNAYWFNGVGRSCWASRNKECIAVIGGHAFYG